MGKRKASGEVVWKKERGGDHVVDLGDERFLLADRSMLDDAVWTWRWSVSDAVDRVADGEARSQEEAKACAVAVARALGWLPAVEAKPERRLVGEWWEVQTRIRGLGQWELVCDGRRASLNEAIAFGHLRNCRFDRIVHVRRYAVGKGKVKP